MGGHNTTLLETLVMSGITYYQAVIAFMGMFYSTCLPCHQPIETLLNHGKRKRNRAQDRRCPL